VGRRIHACHVRRKIHHVSQHTPCEEEDTCMACEEEDSCMTFEEEDTSCVSTHTL
jgi:hypothetical protein